MGRGFLSGIFWGGIVGLVALFVSSQALERQTLSFPKPEAAAVEVPGGSEFNQARPETDPIVPETDARPAGDAVAEVPEPSVADQTPQMDTAALEVPVPDTTQDAPGTLGEAPDAVTDVTRPESSEDTAVGTADTAPLAEPENPGSAPDAATVEATPPVVQPEIEDAPEVETTEDVTPEDESGGIAALPDTDAEAVQPSPETAPQVASQVEAPDSPAAPQAETERSLPWLTQHMNSLGQAPDAPDLPDVAAEPSLPAAGTQAPEAPDVSVAETPSDASSDAAVQQVVEAGEPESADEPEPLVIAQDSAGTEAQQADNSDGTSSLLQPVESLTERESGNASDGSLPVVRRLGESGSTLTDSADDAVVEAEDAPVDAVEENGEATGAPALQAFASAFDASEGTPMISIVLVQTGPEALSSDTLDFLPEHVAFGIDASLSGAPEVARAYRAAGHEVVMIPSLPAGAAPQDIEEALSINFERIPEAVALMDVSGSSFQSDRDAVSQVVRVIEDTGHGLITFPRGLNTAHQVAQRSGVPTGLIFRILDGEGESIEEIGRTLDRAAFRARQDTGVILVGTTGSTMLSALTEWVLTNGDEAVAIAPVSKALGG